MGRRFRSTVSNHDCRRVGASGCTAVELGGTVGCNLGTLLVLYAAAHDRRRRPCACPLETWETTWAYVQYSTAFRPYFLNKAATAHSQQHLPGIYCTQNRNSVRRFAK